MIYNLIYKVYGVRTVDTVHAINRRAVMSHFLAHCQQEEKGVRLLKIERIG